jgi:hypothetical protein
MSFWPLAWSAKIYDFLVISDDDDEMEYMPQMKMELPEYIDVNVPGVDGEHITTTTTITTPTETTSYIHGKVAKWLKRTRIEL